MTGKMVAIESHPTAQVPGGAAPRLFRATGVRVNPQVEWVEVQVKSVINRVQGMPFKWSINPYRGCEHGCTFCFARLTHWYLDQDGVRNWSTRIFVKVNAPEVLRQELGRPSWQHEEVNIGTATDPYQPAEGAYKITRQILEALRDYRTPVAIITRSTMVVRDTDVLQQLARGPGAMVCFSLSTVDEALARELEPNAPPPLKRLEAMQTLSRAGVPTGLILAPVLPGITDHPRQLGAVIETAQQYGASTLWTIPLHLGDVTRQTFFEYLEHKRPHLVPEYERLYRGKYAPASYRRHVQEVVSALKRRYGLQDPPPERRSPQPGPPPPEQLNLL